MNDAAVTIATVEGYDAISQCIESVILAHADVGAGIVHSATLTHDDVAGDALLTAPNLNTESL